MDRVSKRLSQSGFGGPWEEARNTQPQIMGLVAQHPFHPIYQVTKQSKHVPRRPRREEIKREGTAVKEDKGNGTLGVGCVVWSLLALEL